MLMNSVCPSGSVPILQQEVAAFTAETYGLCTAPDQLWMGRDGFLRFCVLRFKRPMHYRYTTIPEASYRIRTRIGGLEILCPFH